MKKGEIIVAVAQHFKFPESLEKARIQLQTKQLEHEKELKQLEFKIKEREEQQAKQFELQQKRK